MPKLKITHTANEAARAIVRMVEQETGKELSLPAALRIVAVVQVAMNRR